MPGAKANHYAALGLDRQCTADQIRSAYRILAKQHHPDLNPDSPTAVLCTLQINAAYEILGDPDHRLAYDRTLAAASESSPSRRRSKAGCNLSHEIHLRIEEFFRGTSLEVRVHDPGNPQGPESYRLDVPPLTAPGTRFRVPRRAPFEGGVVVIRARVRPDSRFKVRGSDLRRDLRIPLPRAAQGGSERIQGVTGTLLTVPIPRGVGRGEIIRIPGEGLPKARGGRGDLLVRITYRPEIRVIRRMGP